MEVAKTYVIQEEITSLRTQRSLKQVQTFFDLLAEEVLVISLTQLERVFNSNSVSLHKLLSVVSDV